MFPPLLWIWELISNRLIPLFRLALQKVLRDFYSGQDEAVTPLSKLQKFTCVPTHSLELIEVAALKEAVKQKVIEPREPQVLCFDVLVQFLMTLAVGDGFYPPEL